MSANPPPGPVVDDDVDLASLPRLHDVLDLSDARITRRGLARVLDLLRRDEEIGSVRFDGAVFAQRADFDGRELPACSFRGAQFEEGAGFTRCSFSGDADFTGATAGGDGLDLSNATFSGDVRFDHAELTGLTARRAVFSGWSSFRELEAEAADLSRVRFADDAVFRDAVFGGSESGDDGAQDRQSGTVRPGAGFPGARFEGRADFSGAQWRGAERPDFSDAVFGGPVSFARARTALQPSFAGAVAASAPSFRHARNFPFAARADVQQKQDGGAGASADAGGFRLSWDSLVQVLQLVSLGAALVVWVILVGGAVVFARVSAAGLPQPTRTVTLVPQEAFIAQGLRALSWPLLVASLAALLTYLLRSSAETHAPIRGLLTNPRVVRLAPRAGAALLLGLAVWWVVAIFSDFEAWYVLAMGAVLVAVPGLMWLGYNRWSSAAAVAVLVFAGILALAGGIVWVSEAGDRAPEFEPATVLFGDGGVTTGLLFAQTDDEVVLICNDGLPEEGIERRLVMLPRGDVAALTVKRAVDLPGPDEDEQPLALSCTVPGGGGEEAGGDVEGHPPRPGREPPPSSEPQPGGEGTEQQEPEQQEPEQQEPERQEPERQEPERQEPEQQDPERQETGGQSAPPSIAGPLRGSAGVRRSGLVLVRLGRFERRVSGVMQLITMRRFEREGWDRPRRVRLGTKAFRAGPREAALVQFHLSGFAQARLREAGADGLATSLRVRASSATGASASRSFGLVLRLRG